MKLVLFSKSFKGKTPGDLVDTATGCGADGYDLCIREGHQVTPQNVAAELGPLAAFLRSHGLDVPMASADVRLNRHDDPCVRPMLRALAETGVGCLKLGYFVFDPRKSQYQAYLSEVRSELFEWQRLSREYSVKICYHTHSGPCMGLNGAALEGMLRDYDPACLGAYIDPAHLLVNGEAFEIALAMLEPYLALVGLKDVLLTRKPRNGHGSVAVDWVRAGDGMVDWTLVFAELRRCGYDGIYSLHCEFIISETAEGDAVAAEVKFFKDRI